MREHSISYSVGQEARQPAAESQRNVCGALVISLDFELHWGVRDVRPLDAGERKRLLRARAVIPRLLDTFEEFSIHATWATVGLLFARSRKEAEAFRPRISPQYTDQRLNPYLEPIGIDEHEDPFHFAPSLINAIASRENQEIGCHSFSHYYCMEAGQGAAEFEADLSSAVAIAAHSGYQLNSYVFPRNQIRPSYLAALDRAGILAYRDNESAAAKASAAFRQQRRPWRRVTRWLDSHVNLCGRQTAAWPATRPAALAASMYLRPHDMVSALQSLRLRRIEQGLEDAAKNRKIFHLWWHPEDFASECETSLQMLRRVLELFDAQRRRYGMLSLTMAEAATRAGVDASGATRHEELSFRN